ncbi:MAG TPA: hypothetical protein DEP28_03410, partial [Bacteroidetes bacterium]|nr:hypothetical protein [Bacteroidota bacterium]
MYKKVCFIICSNGLGHFKRSIIFAEKLLELIPNINVCIYCESWQIVYLKKFLKGFMYLNSSRCNFRFSEFQMKWYENQTKFTSEYFNLDSFNKIFYENEFDLVISDNYIEPLMFSEKVVISGSFLWCDVLK